ncbi:MAG: hypothetical protein ABI682_15275 [Acidobacteriota bacterium]
MHALTVAAAVFLLAGPSSNAVASQARSPLWGDLEPGPHAVGFRQLERYDYSRVHRLARDLDGRPRAGERARPIRVSIWYPAEPSSRAPLTWGDYAAMAAGEERFGSLTPERVRLGQDTVFGFPLFRDLHPDQRRRLAAIPAAAVRDAVPLRGPFPLVLYSLGSTFLAHVTPEHLASHGYVVVQSPRVGATAGLPPENRDREDLVTKIRDIDFLIDVMHEFPAADVHRLGAVGFSAGGRWALSEAMQNPDVRAVVSLDSVMLFKDPTLDAWKQLPLFNLEAVRVPVLHCIRRAWVPLEDATLWESLKYAERTYAVFEQAGLDHLDFQSAGWALELAGARPELRPKVGSAFTLWSRWTLAFLDLHVKGDGKAREVLARMGTPQDAPAGFVTVSRKAAAVPPPTIAEVMNAIADDNMDSVERVCRAGLRETGKPPVPENVLNLAGYNLLFSGRRPEALRLLSLNAEMFPHSGNALDSLADAYQAAGDRARARELAVEAKALVEKDTSLDPDRKKRILENIETKLHSD